MTGRSLGLVPWDLLSDQRRIAARPILVLFAMEPSSNNDLVDNHEEGVMASDMSTQVLEMPLLGKKSPLEHGQYPSHQCSSWQSVTA